jgi:hypothetical protein
MSTHQNNAPDDVSTSYTNVSTESTKTASPSVTALKQRRRQRFSLESNQIYPVVNIDDMDKADIHETWYEKRDYNSMTKSIIYYLRKVANAGRKAETKTQTLRGLENRTNEATLLRKSLRLAAFAAVMNEQERQWDEGEKDDELLAKVCRDATSYCQEENHALALQDEAALKTEYEKMRRKLALDLQKESGRKDKRSFKAVSFLSTRNMFSDSETKLAGLPASRNLVTDCEKSPSRISDALKQVRTIGSASQIYAGKAA